jgi:CDP-diacylglycerol--glycerol-3-phosphate 3-phosphatidyltransferase
MIAVFQDRIISPFIILICAALTDFFDGLIARRWKMQTRIGRMLDPIADKIFIFFAILSLLIRFQLPIWIALIIIVRDLIILTGSIIYLYKNKSKVLKPIFLGKLTTFLQMASIIFFVLNIPYIIKYTILILAVILTVISGIIYILKGYYLIFHKTRRTRRSQKINLPNKITILRILFIPIFIAFLLSDLSYRITAATILFILLASSDALDGYLARKMQAITTFGKLIDPLADKLLVSAALIFLIGQGIRPWMAYTILAREFVITGIRMIAITKGVVLPSRISGKIKTFVQVVAITSVMLRFTYSWHLMVLAVAITVYSGIEYIWVTRHLFKELA